MFRTKLLGILLAGIVIVGMTSSAQAAQQDSKVVTVNASMEAHVEVVVDTQNTVASTKIQHDGDLTQAAKAAFIVNTNSSNGADVTYQASVQSADAGPVNAFDANLDHIAIANGLTPPMANAVNNSLGAAPQETLNSNVIAYPVLFTPNKPPVLINAPSGNTAVEIQQADRAETFGGSDAHGNYTVTITCNAIANP